MCDTVLSDRVQCLSLFYPTSVSVCLSYETEVSMRGSLMRLRSVCVTQSYQTEDGVSDTVLSDRFQCV